MRTRFILGPAGSGKTYRCLVEIRDALIAAPDGPPLLLIAPNQTTYQFERELLAAVPGYTRLQILSFERLAAFVFDQLRQSKPRLLNEEGRLMVLRSLLAKKRDQLKLFRASARLTGFAQHLSLVLRELQRHALAPEYLEQVAAELPEIAGLKLKLQDLASLLRDYLDWLRAHDLQDADYLLKSATEILRAPHTPMRLGELWLDGFSELSPQELDLLAELIPHTATATLAFCLDGESSQKVSWLGQWTVVRRTYQQCKHRLAGLANNEVSTEILPRRTENNRFQNNPVLRRLEEHWTDNKNIDVAITPSDGGLKKSLSIVACANPEAEAVRAAREILRFVRTGGRYREIAVITRDLKAYHAPLTSVFNRYGIPFFLDRRESISHHPLAELARNALRTVALNWNRDDWFAALKTGLVPAEETEIDRLENEALARGWRGDVWQKPLMTGEQPDAELESLRQRLMKPFNNFYKSLGKRPSGTELANAFRDLWEALRVADTLQKWSTDANEPIHLTVWERMNAWLENVELAFPVETLPLREWMPILEAGLTGLTAGVIPPALDQVMIGAIDRSRNPDIRLALVLGMNETVFPAAPKPSVVLTDADRLELEKHEINLATARQQMSQERFYGYIACTRARERLVLTYCAADARGKALNPSHFIAHLRKIFPALEVEIDKPRDWRESEHPSELIAPLLRNQTDTNKNADLARLNELPALAPWREKLGQLVAVPSVESLSPALAEQLYGMAMKTSVSRMEEFAACPFKFFVHSGLRAEERKWFELDVREKGNFQHDVLKAFHESLQNEGLRWRDITPVEARERINTVAHETIKKFGEGLLLSDEGKFAAKIMIESLQDFVETLTGWMNQYAFDPKCVELPFGQENFPPWDLDLGGGHRLLLRGRIDRIDILPAPNGESTLCVVVDYKSSLKKLDGLLMQSGLQLQLPAYLNVLRHWQNPQPMFGAKKLVPAGVFYVNLRGDYERGKNRDETLAGAGEARKLAYRHTGRFDADALRHLDQRANMAEGDQFNYRRKKDGGLNSNSREALKAEEFIGLLDDVETSLTRMGKAVYTGEAKIDPYRKGTMIACEQCDYQAICRIDPWTHNYRVLKKDQAEETEE